MRLCSLVLEMNTSINCGAWTWAPAPIQGQIWCFVNSFQTTTPGGHHQLNVL